MTLSLLSRITHGSLEAAARQGRDLDACHIEPQLMEYIVILMAYTFTTRKRARDGSVVADHWTVKADDEPLKEDIEPISGFESPK